MMYTCDRIKVSALLLRALIYMGALWGCSGHGEAFAPMYPFRSIFDEAITSEKVEAPADRHVTGITVPHHLLVPHLIARAFYLASGGDYERLIILFPDHFRKTKMPFATSAKAFETVFGTLESDSDAVSALSHSCETMEESDLFAKDHGIQAIVPFAAHFFPRAKVVPVALSIDSSENQWRQLADALKPLITEKTLIIQSTDFSHYLPQAIARQRDQETLNVLAAADPSPISHLVQPDHMDSLAAQWVHMVLQKEIFGATPSVIENQNSQEFSPTPIRETTSYIVQVYEKPPIQSNPWPACPGDELYFFAGDTFLGRHMTDILANSDKARSIQEKILNLTRGRPLILNLEGVLLSFVPEKVGPLTLAMPEDLALQWLKALHTVAVSLANNHAYDLGEDALRRTRRLLEANGIAVIEHGQSHDFGPFRLLAYTDLCNRRPPYRGLLSRQDLASLQARELSSPVVAFLHWGTEFNCLPGSHEEQLTSALNEAGANVLVGCHPHVASPGIEALAGGSYARVFSLGNFLFDQKDPASGAILEMRCFRQGTYSLKLHSIGNLFVSQ